MVRSAPPSPPCSARLEADGTFEYALSGRLYPLTEQGVFQEMPPGLLGDPNYQAYMDAHWGKDRGSTCDHWLCQSGQSYANGREPAGGMPDGYMRGMPCSPDGGVAVTCNSCLNVPIGPGNCPGNAEGITTTIVDLVPGEDYALSFWQAHGGFAPGTFEEYPATPEGALTHWRVEITPQDGTAVTAESPDMPYLGEGKQVWERVSVPFTAGTGTTADLVLKGDPSWKEGGNHRVMAVDDVKVECIKE